MNFTLFLLLLLLAGHTDIVELGSTEGTHTEKHEQAQMCTLTHKHKWMCALVNTHTHTHTNSPS